MPICPRCETPVTPSALNCSQCGLQLKAHGHPSIELHQAISGDALCLSCAYHADDSCTFPQRPEAQSCTLYQSVTAAEEAVIGPSRSPTTSFKALWQRYRLWWILLALFGISLLITLF